MRFDSIFAAGISIVLLLGLPAGYSKIARAAYPDLASPDLWCDRGDSFREHGDDRKAGYCYRRAVVMGPRDKPVLMRAGNYFMLQNDAADAS